MNLIAMKGTDQLELEEGQNPVRPNLSVSIEDYEFGMKVAFFENLGWVLTC